MTGIVQVLERYPPQVIEAVVDPFRGLPGKIKFWPSIAEVKQACDVEMEPILRQRERDRVVQQSRQMLADMCDPAPRATYEELVARYGADWGIRQDRGRVQVVETAGEAEAKLRAIVGDAAFDAIPNQPGSLLARGMRPLAAAAEAAAATARPAGPAPPPPVETTEQARTALAQEFWR